MLCFRCGSYNADSAAKCSVCGQDFLERAPQREQRTVANARKQSQTGLPSSIFVPGETVAGRYKIGELLGQGGVGAVYRARDLEIDVDVALKAISPNLLQTDEEQKNFSKQIRAARKLQHQNIVRIYDEAHEGPRRFYTMKLLEGLTLRKIIRLRHEKGQAFSPEELGPIFQQLAAAMDYAHKTTWHGDLKPENVIILPDLLKVTDFNLVKALPLKPFLGIAKSRSKGFPYIAPELRVEATHIDGRCDVYSMGVILAEMLTGLVYEGHFTRALTAALELLPTKLDGLVRRALSEHPDGRFPKASEMATELEAALGALGDDGLPPPVVPTGAPSKPPQSLAGPTSPPMSPPMSPPRAAGTSPGRPIADITDEDREALKDEPRKNSEDLVEIGQSQVVLLESLTHRPELLAAAARRILVTEKESAEGTDSADRGPQVSGPSGRRPLKAEDLIDTLYSDEDEQGLIPPPLPDGSGPDVTDDDLDKIGRDESEEITAENPRMAGMARAEKAKASPAPLASSDPSHEISAEDDHALLPPPIGADDGIHDALTALKSHPRRDLVDRELKDTAEPDPFAAATALPQKGKGQKAPSIDDEEDEEPSLPPHVLAAAQERSSPRLRQAPPIPPPVAPTKSGASGSKGAGKEPKSGPKKDAPKLPVKTTPVRPSRAERRGELDPSMPTPQLRPVAPPVKKKGETGRTVAIVAGLAGAAVILFGLIAVFSSKPAEQTGDPDLVLVKDAGLPSSVALAPIPSPPLVPILGDAGPLSVEKKRTPAEEARLAEENRQADEIRRLDDMKKTQATMQAKLEGKDPGERQRLIEEEKKNVEERALAEAKARAEREARLPDPGKKAADDAKKAADDAKKAADAKAAADEAAAQKAADAKAAADAEAAASSTVAMTEVECPRGMAKIEGGSFTMGSKANDDMRNFGEKSAESTDVKGYCVDYYEFPNGSSVVPTVNVTWQAAKGMCEGKGKRLCSEAEWENACKGPNGLRFPYGNTYDAATCNTVDDKGNARALAAAKDFKACRSGFKVFAMAGNAEEWTSDGFQGGAQKTVKGGAADRPDFASRCASRRGLAGKSTSPTLGFRCCADLK